MPAATDIACEIGICALLGRVVPASLKMFLLALAIIDDLMAIVVIAIFYTEDLSELALALGGIGVAGLVALNLHNVRKPAPYVIVGLFTWVCVIEDAGGRNPCRCCRRLCDTACPSSRKKPARRHGACAQTLGKLCGRTNFRLCQCRRAPRGNISFDPHRTSSFSGLFRVCSWVNNLVSLEP